MSCEMTTNWGRRGVHGSVELSRTTVNYAMVIIYCTSSSVCMLPTWQALGLQQ